MSGTAGSRECLTPRIVCFTTCASRGCDLRISRLRLQHLSATTPASLGYDSSISRLRLQHLSATTPASLGYDSSI
ncbi:MAG: hypothetical protein LBH75_03165, partial [Treponema sp.]|nr:hypothetical protein [Treponema sp.]